MLRPIFLFTDYGTNGPYVGQLKSALLSGEFAGPIIDLQSDAPVFDARASAHLLAALLPFTPAAAVGVCVVDPGVGGERAALAVEIDGRILVGPDNGLLALAAKQGNEVQVWSIDWRPDQLSATFHGRDLFAPLAAQLALGRPPAPPWCHRIDGMVGQDWPNDWAVTIYTDGFGNVMTGLGGDTLDPACELMVNGHVLRSARTFSDLPPGQPFWYVNSIGLVELSVNQGRADRVLSLAGRVAVEVRKNQDATKTASA